MIAPDAFLEALRNQGISFFAGVPDSLLKNFCAYVTDHTQPGEHIIAANEGSAVGLATGHYLATGSPALVYMQNSGFGNALNPMLSLADPAVYSVPMLLLIGWRGEPGHDDEPQHLKQGRIMEPLLGALELDYAVLERETPNPAALVTEAAQAALNHGTPYAILVRRGTFAAYEPRSRAHSDFPLTREAAVKLVAESLRGRHAVVSTTGKTSRELFEYREASGQGHAQDFLTVGGMGHASQIALGLALHCSDLQVYCLDGDGAVIMHMGALAVNAAEAPRNYKHIVLNNGAHDSVGGQPTVGFRMDLPGIASACGYQVAIRARTSDEVRDGLARLASSPGPALLEIQVKKGARADLGRPTTSPTENRDALMRYVGTEPRT